MRSFERDFRSIRESVCGVSKGRNVICRIVEKSVGYEFDGVLNIR